MSGSRQVFPPNLRKPAGMTGGQKQACCCGYDPVAMLLEPINPLLVRFGWARPEVAQSRIPDLAGGSLVAIHHPEPNALSPMLEFGLGLFIENVSHD
jgi:hypothetical protein